MVCSFFKTSNPKVLTIFRTSFSDCNCNDTGSDNHTRCDRTTGQCYCKPGVTSRVCDQCMVQHTNFSGDGCDREYSFIVVIKFQKTKSTIYLKDKSYNLASKNDDEKDAFFTNQIVITSSVTIIYK